MTVSLRGPRASWLWLFQHSSGKTRSWVSAGWWGAESLLGLNLPVTLPDEWPLLRRPQGQPQPPANSSMAASPSKTRFCIFLEGEMGNLLLHFWEDNECWGACTIRLRHYLQEGPAGTGVHRALRGRPNWGSVSRVWVNQERDQGSKVLRSRGSISTKDVKRKSASLAILGKINFYFMV